MAGKQRKQRQPSALSQALILYRNKHKFTQEELATLLDTEPRTLRRWENGETVLTDTRELKHIADRLGIPYDHLGIAPSLYIPLSIEQINITAARIWSLIDDGRISEAHAIAENLVREASHQLTTDDQNYLRSYAHMYHATAHATSLSVRTDDVGQAIYYYQQMEYFARTIHDNTLINISLAYQGDMYRRKNDLHKAITKTSEDIAYAVAEQPRSTRNQYHLAHVYEEYAKGYDLLGKPQLALDYIDKAEKSHVITKSVDILLKVARAEILIHSGDIKAGERLAVEAAVYTKEHGHLRRLERIYALKRFLNRQATRYGRAEASLSEALEGSLEL